MAATARRTLPCSTAILANALAMPSEARKLICMVLAAVSRTKVGEGRKYSFPIFFTESDQDIEVFGGAGFSMNTYRVGPYDKILNVVGVERE